ncbi:S-adenosyl-l-methionine hydroxide adenosyltransferase family protein [Dactylosporangium sp. NPDC000521]|uniref:SAM hydrolase/SAM-dependent halogenase family protein n=1 Tax=Dactylosporangium sp. NPDC000521 TaxID=3363975 RepID=UPI00368F3639
MESWISFTTDYGLEDGFVAACHGVIAHLAPAARVIDVTHLVPPGDVSRGAHVLAQTVPSLPRGVHLAVVDPGVGTARRPIAIEAADGGFLVGPDNGLLIPAAEALGGIRRAVHLTNAAWFAPDVSRTFHGRDLFAPVAARLATGADLSSAGSATAALVRLPPLELDRLPSGVAAPVLTVDRFGNLQLACSSGVTFSGRLTVNGHPATAGGTFGDAPAGGLVVFTDSAGYLAVAVNGGSAATLLGVRAGDRVTVLHDA